MDAKREEDTNGLREMDLSDPPAYTPSDYSSLKAQSFEMNATSKDAPYQGDAAKGALGGNGGFWESIAICGLCLSCVSTALFCFSVFN